MSEMEFQCLQVGLIASNNLFRFRSGMSSLLSAFLVFSSLFAFFVIVTLFAFLHVLVARIFAILHFP